MTVKRSNKRTNSRFSKKQKALYNGRIIEYKQAPDGRKSCPFRRESVQVFH